MGAVAGEVGEPESRPADVGGVVSAAPAHDPPRTRSRADRDGDSPRTVAPIPIPTPLENVPAHGIEAPGIGDLLAGFAGPPRIVREALKAKGGPQGKRDSTPGQAGAGVSDVSATATSSTPQDRHMRPCRGARN